MGFSYSLDFQTLASNYKAGMLTPTAVVAEVFSRIQASGDDHVWTHVLPQGEVMQAARAIEERRSRQNETGSELPLYGLPFAIKDNIDVAGLPTTAACPAFAYVAEKTATIVDALCQAGALLIGKTNLDQFANGLVGTRSPYGVSRNAIDP